MVVIHILQNVPELIINLSYITGQYLFKSFLVCLITFVVETSTLKHHMYNQKCYMI